MCGIVGVVGNKKFDAYFSVHLAKLLHEAEIRGREAFGYIVAGTPGFHIEKHPGSPSKFFSKPKRIKRFVKRLNGMSTFIGHTRSATSSSAQENKNNHPFATKRFSLSHNGHISNHEELLKGYGITSKITTDSFAILALIDMYVRVQRMEVIEAIKATTSLIQGSYSCWLFDKEDGKIYLFRHNNPCSYFVQDGCLFFASTSLILKRAFSINGEFKSEDTGEHLIFSFTPGDADIQQESEFTPRRFQNSQVYSTQQMDARAAMYPYAYMRDEGTEEILALSGATEEDVREAVGHPELYFHKICERCHVFDGIQNQQDVVGEEGLYACRKCKVFSDAVDDGVSWVSLLQSNHKFISDMRVATGLLHMEVEYDRHKDTIVFTKLGGSVLSVDGITALIWHLKSMYKDMLTKGYWPTHSLGLISYWEDE